MTGETQRTRCWHLPEKTAGHLADRAIDGFFEYFKEMDPRSAGQRERACVTRFLEQGIASACPLEARGREREAASVSGFLGGSHR